MTLPLALARAPIDPDTVGRYTRRRRGMVGGAAVLNVEDDRTADPDFGVDYYTAAQVTEDYDCETRTGVLKALGPGHTIVPLEGMEPRELPASWIVVLDREPEIAWPVTENELYNEWTLIDG